MEGRCNFKSFLFSIPPYFITEHVLYACNSWMAFVSYFPSYFLIHNQCWECTNLSLTSMYQWSKWENSNNNLLSTEKRIKILKTDKLNSIIPNIYSVFVDIIWIMICDKSWLCWTPHSVPKPTWSQFIPCKASVCPTRAM